MATALKRPDAPFTIGVSCPGCGGEVELDQGFFVTTCRHCGSALRVVAPDVPPAFFASPKINPSQARAAVDRYLKEQGLPLTNSQLEIKSALYPYWKLDALSLKIRHVVEERQNCADPESGDQPEPETKITRTVSLAPCSISVRAGVEDTLIPATIGLRAEYLKLRPYDEDRCPEGFDAYYVVRAWGDALSQAQSTTKAMTFLASEGQDGNRTDLLYARASIIYIPYFIMESYIGTIRRTAVDAVSGRVTGHEEHSLESPAPAAPPDDPSIQFGQLNVEFHRCATCGEDLPTEPSYLYVCRNCGRITTLASARNAIIECFSHSEDDLLVPFWKITSMTTNQNIMVPAFRIANAEAGYRLARRMTGAVSKLHANTAPPSGISHMAPVNVDRREAQALADIAVYRSALERDDNAHFASSFDPETASLTFVPFHAQEYFWVDSILNAVTFERALLREHSETIEPKRR